MTRPRARPKPGRYYIVTDADGDIWTAYEKLAQATRHVESCAALCGIVECVPVPRVTRRTQNEWSTVLVNGIEVFDGPVINATNLARDLRRALRGDAATKGGG